MACVIEGRIKNKYFPKKMIINLIILRINAKKGEKEIKVGIKSEDQI